MFRATALACIFISKIRNARYRSIQGGVNHRDVPVVPGDELKHQNSLVSEDSLYQTPAQKGERNYRISAVPEEVDNLNLSVSEEGHDQNTSVTEEIPVECPLLDPEESRYLILDATDEGQNTHQISNIKESSQHLTPDALEEVQIEHQIPNTKEDQHKIPNATKEIQNVYEIPGIDDESQHLIPDATEEVEIEHQIPNTKEDHLLIPNATEEIQNVHQILDIDKSQHLIPDATQEVQSECQASYNEESQHLIPVTNEGSQNECQVADIEECQLLVPNVTDEIQSLNQVSGISGTCQVLFATNESQYEAPAADSRGQYQPEILEQTIDMIPNEPGETRSTVLFTLEESLYETPSPANESPNELQIVPQERRNLQVRRLEDSQHQFQISTFGENLQLTPAITEESQRTIRVTTMGHKCGEVSDHDTRSDTEEGNSERPPEQMEHLVNNDGNGSCSQPVEKANSSEKPTKRQNEEESQGPSPKRICDETNCRQSSADSTRFDSMIECGAPSSASVDASTELQNRDAEPVHGRTGESLIRTPGNPRNERALAVSPINNIDNTDLLHELLRNSLPSSSAAAHIDDMDNDTLFQELFSPIPNLPHDAAVLYIPLEDEFIEDLILDRAIDNNNYDDDQDFYSF